MKGPAADAALTTDEIPYPPRALPSTHHYELRRCRIPGCAQWPHPMAPGAWEVVHCFRHDEVPPRYEDVMATWVGAATYPHTYLVAVVTNWCRRELNEATGE